MQSGLLLNVIVSQSATILQLLPCKDQPLLVRGNSFLVLDLRLHVIYRIGTLHLQSDGFPCQSLHKDLHAAAQAKNQVQS
ncbi:hypothetical protein CY35_02G118500 [Sphagnum magellanicum]|nr:hypothetical protein CY35_02G118500 [Sphagnum magellanicum]